MRRLRRRKKTGVGRQETGDKGISDCGLAVAAQIRNPQSLPMLYTLFPTAWGFFGLACQGDRVCRSSLPLRDRAAARAQLLIGLAHATEEPGLAGDLQARIVAYFDGSDIGFGDVRVDVDGMADFSRQVLDACRKVGLGSTVTYGDLACKIGRPKAARAVGGALGRNPIPLIIPCHRVLRSTGLLGGFSAPGGTAYKARLLQHEKALRPA
jgi:methylated-DNA-[protein]-cysteine S-methyltransferase